MSCIFCKIINGHAPGFVLYRDEFVVVFLSLEGHPLVVPVKHVASLAELDDDIGAALFKCAMTIARALPAATKCDGLNLILSDGEAAGQDVFHLHLHVKPRWSHDAVTLTWDTKPLSVEERRAIASNIEAYLPKTPFKPFE